MYLQKRGAAPAAKSITKAVAFAAALLAASTAQAELLNYSAVDFERRCPCAVEPNTEELDNGVLRTVDSNSSFYHAVDFPANGQRICRVLMTYHDVNASEPITARLFKKKVNLNGNAFNPPTQIAIVNSASGIPNTARRSSTSAIAEPVIAEGLAFYYIQVTANVNHSLIGVQIDVRQTCP